MCNWRPFYGDHEIRFSTDRNAPVTLIFGANGGGKTSILTAMYWCLYNSTEVDPTTRGSHKDLFNERAVGEIAPGSSAVAWVELELQAGPDADTSAVYTVKREITADKKSDGAVTYGTQVTCTEREGDHVVTEHSDAKVRHILDRRLAKYFFHAAETMAFPFESSKKSREELRDCLFKVVGQEELDIVIQQTGNAVAALEVKRKQAESAAGVRTAHEATIATIEKQIADKTAEAETKSHELTAAENQLGIFLAQLSAVEEFEPLVKERERCEKELEGAEGLLKEREGRLSDKTRYLWRVPAGPLVGAFCEWFTPRAKEFPTLVNQNVVLHLKERGLCICGRPVEEEHIHAVEALLEGADDEAARRLTTLYDLTKDWSEDVKELDTEFRKAKAAVTQAERAVDEWKGLVLLAKKAIDDHGDEPKETDLGQLRANVRDRDRAVNKLRGRIEGLEGEIRQLKIDRATAERERGESATDAELRAAEARLLVARMTEALAEEVKEIHAQVARPRLEEEMNKNYWSFKADRMIRISEDWMVTTVDVTDGGAREVEVGGSGSETNLLTYAFAGATAALIPQFKLAGPAALPDSDVVEQAGTYPLVVDAPFSTLGPNYKNKVAAELPDAVDQLVLLNEADDLDRFRTMHSAGKIGRLYSVHYTGPLEALHGTFVTEFEFANHNIEYLKNGTEDEKTSVVNKHDLGD
jgi:DNA sulfur modification protein DndD